MQPNQYLFNEPTGKNPVMQGFGQGANLAALQQGMAQKQKEATLKAAMDAEAAELSKNPTSSGIRDFTIKYGLGDKMKTQMEHLSAEEKENKTAQGAGIYSALSRGNVSVARARAAELAETYKNAGQKDYAQMYEDLVEDIDEDPGAARFSLGIIMSGVMGDDFKIFTDMEETAAKTSEADANAGLKRQELKNAPEVHASKMAEIKATTEKTVIENARDTLASGNLGAPQRAEYTETMANSRKGYADHKKVSSLLRKLPGEMIGGAFKLNSRKLIDWWTGGTVEVASFKQQLESYKLVDMLKNKPPGALSEGELAVLQAGVPKEGAKAEVIEEYLRISQKAIETSVGYDKLKLKFMDLNSDVTGAKEDFEVYGIPVKKGTNFDEFIESVGDSISNFGPTGNGVLNQIEDAPPLNMLPKNKGGARRRVWNPATGTLE